MNDKNGRLTVVNMQSCTVYSLLENLTDAAIAYCDEIFYHFPLFDETLRHIGLCKRAISPIQRNPPKQCPSVVSSQRSPSCGYCALHAGVAFKCHYLVPSDLLTLQKVWTATAVTHLSPAYKLYIYMYSTKYICTNVESLSSNVKIF